MPLEAETHAVRTGMAMPPLAETAFRRSGICTAGGFIWQERQEVIVQLVLLKRNTIFQLELSETKTEEIHVATNSLEQYAKKIRRNNPQSLGV